MSLKYNSNLGFTDAIFDFRYIEEWAIFEKTSFFRNESYLYSHLHIIDNIWPPEYYINFTIMS